MKKNAVLKSSLSLIPLAFSVVAPCADAAGNSLPNIVYIMCDDMGYGDLGCYGQPYISTPNIDSLARQGIRFTQAYAGSPVSAPSRASLMTGQHTGHTAVRGNKEYWRNADIVKYGNNDDYAVVGQHPYDTARVIIPEILKDNGYTTGLFGKWAGGYEGSVSTPDKRGIDNFYGYICQFQAHLYYPNFLNRYDPALGDTAVVRVTMDRNIDYPMFGDDYAKRSQYSADMIHRKALEWIRSQDGDQPFAAFLTYTLPHAELYQPNDSILQAYRRTFTDDHDFAGWEGSRYNATKDVHAQFAAMITRLDSYVGEVVETLKEKGFDENTVIVFTSDNGPHEEGGADPTFFGRDGKLRGLKRQCYEGGIRIPFIVNWKGKTAPGTESDHQLAFYDVMPTICEIIGADMARYDDDPDGISFLPALVGEPQPQHDFLYWEFHETDQIGVRAGDWKMVVKGGVPHLYNLADDIGETTDVASDHPDIVARLVEIVYREHQPNKLFPVTLPPTKAAGDSAVVYRRDNFGSKFFRIPAIVTAADGSLVTVADKRIEHNGDLPAKIDVVSRRSLDGGKTWEPYVTVAEHDSIGGCGDPALVVDRKSGDILAIFSHGNGLWGDTPAHISVARSSDNGVTWGGMTDINPQILTTDPDGPQPIKCNAAFASSGRAVQLADGRILFALVVRDKNIDTFNVYAVYSDDGGYNWNVSKTPGTTDGDESKIVELADGTLIMSIRNRYGASRFNNRHLFSYSKDRGEHWAGPRQLSDVFDPACNGDIIACDYKGKEVLLLSLPGSKNRRENVTVYASVDGGKTFPYSKVISECPSAYSSMTITDDGKLAILVEESEEGKPGYDLIFHSLPLTDILPF